MVFWGTARVGILTAVAVVSDLMSIAHGAVTVDLPSRKTVVGGEFLLRHSIRFVVRDQPGIIAEIALALAEQGINIHAIFQKPGYGDESLPFVVTVEACGCRRWRGLWSGLGGWSVCWRGRLIWRLLGDSIPTSLRDVGHPGSYRLKRRRSLDCAALRSMTMF